MTQKERILQLVIDVAAMLTEEGSTAEGIKHAHTLLGAAHDQELAEVEAVVNELIMGIQCQNMLDYNPSDEGEALLNSLYKLGEELVAY